MGSQGIMEIPIRGYQHHMTEKVDEFAVLKILPLPLQKSFGVAFWNFLACYGLFGLVLRLARIRALQEIFMWGVFACNIL